MISPIVRYTLNADEWTAIIAPMNCNYYAFVSDDGSAILRCSDPDNPLAWQNTLGYAFIVPAPSASAATTNIYRFMAGETITWLKAQPGKNTVAVVEFIT